MRYLMIFLLVLVASVALALFVLKDPGYVLVSYQGYTIETTLSLAVVILLGVFLLLSWLLRLGGGIWHIPARMQAWKRQRQQERARKGLYKGLLALAEGRWKQAERSLTRRVRSSEMPLLNYLAAARAAQQQGDTERRDHYLYMAYNSTPTATLAIALTQAELQLAAGQMEQSLATLTNLDGRQGKHDYACRLLLQIYRDLRDWKHLHALLPELRKRGIVPEPELRELEKQVYGHMMQQAAQEQDIHELHRLWRALPRPLQEDAALLANYVHALIELEAAEDAEPLLRHALRRNWSDELVALYGLVEDSNTAKQLSRAEGWLRDHGKDSVLHLALARISMRNRLWGKARIYYETSIEGCPRVEAYHELGTLLEQHLHDKDAATECYRQAATLAEKLQGEAPR